MEPTKEKMKEEKTAKETKEDATKETKEEIKTVRGCLSGKYSGDKHNRGEYIRGNQIILSDGTLYNTERLGIGIFFVLFAIGFEGHISEVDISEIMEETTKGEIKEDVKDETNNKIVYSINHTFDAFGRLNISGNPPEKVSLMVGRRRIFEKKFEDELLLKKEPIILSALRKENLKLVLEYKKVPETPPRILCDVWTLSNNIKQYFQSIVYSEEYDFYYEEGKINSTLQKEESLLQKRYPFLSFEKKDNIMSLREILPEKFSRNGRLVSYNGTPFDISLSEEHRMLISGVHAYALDLNISIITKGIHRDNNLKCIVYGLRRTADLFGRVNILCEKKDAPKYIHFMNSDSIIVSEKFEGKSFLCEEPISLAAVPYDEVKLVLEYEELPEKDPEIICDIYLVSGMLRKQLGCRPYYSEAYKFYYSGGYIKGI